MKLYNGIKILARFAKRNTENGNSPDWGEPKVVTLYVLNKEDSIVELTVEDFPWATYSEIDFDPEFNEFIAEGFRMQILKAEI